MLNTRYLCAIASGVALTLQPVIVGAQNFNKVEEVTIEQKQDLQLEDRSSITYDTYILGPGDGLYIELLDLPELSGKFSIAPDGTLYLPRLRALYVEGMTLEELRYFLTEQFSTYVLDPQVFVHPVIYRPIRIYVGGEVKRPGYYTLGGTISKDNRIEEWIDNERFTNRTLSGPSDIYSDQFKKSQSQTKRSDFFVGPSFVFPTVFDAIKYAQGITPYSNLSKVQVTRKRRLSLGGGHIRTNLDFLSLITNGNESQNIRLYDGDVVRVTKSRVVMRKQLLKAAKTNLSPEFINVFVSGRVNMPGAVVLPQGAVLNQALALAGSPKILKGKVEFIRFTQDGDTNRSRFKYDPGAASNAPNNPVLMAGDLINVNDSLISASTTVLGEITSPIVGAYSLYSILKDFN